MTAFGLGFTPHIERKTGTDLRLRAHAVALLLPRARASVAPLHGMRGRWAQRGITKRPCLCQRGRAALLQRLTARCEPLQATPQRGQRVEGCLGPTASVAHGGDLLHALAALPSRWQTTGEAPQRLARAVAQGMLDAQVSMGAHLGPLLLQPLVLAGGLRRCLRARTSPGSVGWRGPHALSRAGHGAQHRCADLGQDMQRAALMRHLATDLAPRRWRP